MRVAVLVFAVAAAFACAPARAADPAQAEQQPVQAAAPAPDNANKTVCEIRRRTGSHIGAEKICMTREEWDAQHGKGPGLNQNPALTVNSNNAMPTKQN